MTELRLRMGSAGPSTGEGLEGASARKGEASPSQPLQTAWTFWFDRMRPGASYESSLTELGSLSTVQAFWRCVARSQRA